jgi:hypothetical protein
MQQKITEQCFMDILAEAKKRLIKAGLSSIATGEEFQSKLYDVIKAICDERNIHDCEQTGKHSFPDIRIESFGIEAKFTQGDSWTINGNSITESTKKNDYERIYIFFCKRGLENKPEILFRPHDECVSDIIVTHSPRYKINMELKKDQDIFTKMEIDPISFNKRGPNEKVAEVKSYYKRTVKGGQTFWWIDADKGITPIINIFSNLDEDTQTNYIAEVFVLFPEIFSKSNRKYDRPTLLLFQKYQARCSSLRDLFSAGGQKTIKIGATETLRVSKIFHNLYIHAKKIRKILQTIDKTQLATEWEVPIKKTDDVEQIWISLIQKRSNLDKKIINSIYQAGLRVS